MRSYATYISWIKLCASCSPRSFGVWPHACTLLRYRHATENRKTYPPEPTTKTRNCDIKTDGQYMQAACAPYIQGVGFAKCNLFKRPRIRFGMWFLLISKYRMIGNNHLFKIYLIGSIWPSDKHFGRRLRTIPKESTKREWTKISSKKKERFELNFDRTIAFEFTRCESNLVLSLSHFGANYCSWVRGPASHIRYFAIVLFQSHRQRKRWSYRA